METTFSQAEVPGKLGHDRIEVEVGSILDLGADKLSYVPYPSSQYQ